MTSISAIASNPETLDHELLTTVCGGGGGGHRDFAGRYVDNLKQDWNDMTDRMQRATDAINSGNYGEGGKQFAAGVLNDLGMFGDAIAPIRAAVPQS